MTWSMADARRARARDSTRDRSILLNQVLLAGVTLVAALLILALDQVRDATFFTVGLVLLYAAAAAGIVVPWRRLPYAVAGILPIVDIAAIALLRDGAPSAGLGLLWTFPAMWIGSTFGVVGIVAVTAAIGGIVIIDIVSDPTRELSTSIFLLPVTVAALSTISYLATRRANAQRGLLDRQSEDLRRSVDRARRQEDLVTEVLDAVDFGVIRITPDGALVVTNEAHARLQGTHDGDAVDVQAYAADGVTPLGRDQLPLVRARNGDRFENELVWYGSPGQGRRALSVTARGLSDIDGSDAGAIVVSRDVTSEEQALRARDDLVASVSHELRTPLTSIMGYLELALEDERLAEATRRDLEVAQRNAERLLELVADILAMSTVTRRGVELSLDVAPADIAIIVSAAVEAEAPRAAQRRMTIDTSAVHSTFARVDSHRIRQVVDNLLTNAVKYNQDGGDVRVEVAQRGPDVWIAVHDDGPGISGSELPHLFERFFRADAVRNSSIHGSGLGLAISRDIVRAHGGDILVESSPGEGTSFRVRLPIEHVEDAA